MRVLVIGSGAREHALAASLARSERVDAVLTAPGNAGTARVGENVDVPVSDVEALVRLARDRDVELVVVGPEAPLAAGVVDAMTAAGVTAFGPTRAGIGPKIASRIC